MGYQRLGLNELRALASELDRAYNHSNVKRNNPQRKSFIALLKELTRITASNTNDPEKIADILTGAAIFELETIKREYSYLSPEGSDLYCMIMRKLGITDKNPLKDDERLVYLNKFYKFANVLMSEEHVRHVKESVLTTVWQNKQALQKDIHTALKQLRKRDADRINQLIHGTPNLVALQKNIQTIHSNYRAARKKRWKMFQNAHRETMCELTDFVHETCNDFFAGNYNLNPADKKSERLQADECQTRLGLILSILMEINDEYRFLSPQGGWFNSGSELYKETMPILNIKELNQLQYDEKIGWLRALSTHIDHVRNDQPYYQEKQEQWRRRGLNLEKELNKFQAMINEFRDEQEKEKNMPSRTTRVVSTGLSYATQCGLMYGITYAVTQGVARYALTGLGSVVATAVGGPIGLAIYAGSTILMTGLSALVSSNVLTSTTASLYAWILEKIGDTVADAAVGVISYPFSASKEGLDKLRRKLTPENEKLFREWVNTLLELPNDIVTEKEKENIRYVLGLEKDARLQPLPMVELSDAEKLRQEKLSKDGFFGKPTNGKVEIKEENYAPALKNS